MPPIGATVPGYEMKSWLGIAASKDVPQPIVERLNREIRAVLEMPDIKRKLETMGNEMRGSSPPEMRTMIASEITRWKQMIKVAGISQQ